MKPKGKSDGLASGDGGRTLLASLIVLGGLCVIILLWLQPLNAAIMQVILIYFCCFLGLGLLIAAGVNRYLEANVKNEDQPL
jgi:predicted ABC-type exoprotein transport system permease subunit